jgi:hypothetical protein
MKGKTHKKKLIKTHKSIVRISQTSGLLEIYMVVNFKARGINRGVFKLAQTLIFIIKKEKPIKSHVQWYPKNT